MTLVNTSTSKKLGSQREGTYKSEEGDSLNYTFPSPKAADGDVINGRPVGATLRQSREYILHAISSQQRYAINGIMRVRKEYCSPVYSIVIRNNNMRIISLAILN